jgi:Domain of unknown function DUF1828
VKDALCHAFCDSIRVTKVPVGLAVSTAFRRQDGDAIGFYIVGPDSAGHYRIEDDGLTIADLEASGADLDSATRAAAFSQLLEENGALYANAEGILKSQPLNEPEIAAAALRFVALLLRVQDLLLLTPERVASTFREDAIKAIRHAAKGLAAVEKDAPIAAPLQEFPADVVLRTQQRPPVAVFLASTDLRLSEAILLQIVAMHEARVRCSVVALVERQNSISRKMWQRAVNRLAAVPVFEGDREAAISRVIREATGDRQFVM